jgi:hypothetical protein
MAALTLLVSSSVETKFSVRLAVHLRGFRLARLGFSAPA